MGSVTITGNSLQEVLQEAKKKYGSNALVESATNKDGKISVTVITTPYTKDVADNDVKNPKINNKSNLFLSPVTAKNISVKDSVDDQNDKSVRKNYSPLSLVRKISALCEYHLLDFNFCETWLKALEQADFDNDKKDLKKLLSDSLAKIIKPDLDYFKNIKEGDRLIFVGSAGAGKTSALVKMATMLIAKNVKVKIVNFDTFKTGACEQIENYAKILDIPVIHNENKFLNFNPKEVILVDTQGINPHSQQDITTLKNSLEKMKINDFHNKKNSYFLGVVPAYFNVPDIQELVKKLNFFELESLIFTNVDLCKRMGGIIQASFSTAIPLSFYSKSCKIVDGLDPFSSNALLDLININQF
jgi:flagellar biosynthesis GTPase FlhF